jgi:hypothetical protein
MDKIQEKVTDVKKIMHENILVSLENTAKLEHINLVSEELQQSAGLFRNN